MWLSPEASAQTRDVVLEKGSHHPGGVVHRLTEGTSSFNDSWLDGRMDDLAPELHGVPYMGSGVLAAPSACISHFKACP